MMIELEKNLRLVQQRIAKAASRAKRDPKEVTLIAVSKTFPTEAIFGAYQLGVRHFGENRVEEASSKIPDVNIRIGSSERITWHMIGHLQSRKVKDAAELFDYIHSVDSAELAERLNRIGGSLNKMIPIMLEVNVSGETRKYGFQQEPRDAFFNSVSKIMTFESVDVKGLMTLAPMVSNPEEARPSFRSLRVLRDELESRFPNQRFPHLSMGMTDDFETAIEEGATMVRIGRAIFGERAQTSPLKWVR